MIEFSKVLTAGSIAILTAAALIGCGQNPLNRDSDPLKNYNSLRNDLPADKVQTPGGLKCPAPYSSISFTDSNGEPVDGDLVFPAGEKTTYQIHLTSDTRTSFTLVLSGQLNGMTLSPADGKGACKVQIKDNNGMKEGICELSYQPSATANQSTTNFLYHAEVGNKACDDRDERVSRTVQIQPKTGHTTQTPNLQKVTGFSSGKIYGKTDKISFTVETADPNISASETAEAPQFELVDLNPSNKVPYVSAKNTIICGSPEKIKDQNFRFSCTLDFSKLAGAPKSGLARTSFDVYAKSVSQDESSRYGVQLTVSLDDNAPAAGGGTPQ